MRSFRSILRAARYREMLEHALTHHRMFSVALVRPNRLNGKRAPIFSRLDCGIGARLRWSQRWHFAFDWQGLRRVRLKVCPGRTVSDRAHRTLQSDDVASLQRTRSARKFWNCTIASKQAAPVTGQLDVISPICPIRKCWPTSCSTFISDPFVARKCSKNYQSTNDCGWSFNIWAKKPGGKRSPYERARSGTRRPYSSINSDLSFRDVIANVAMQTFTFNPLRRRLA